MSDISSRALRDAFGSFMTGVTVVTTRDTELGEIGFTANSFTSVSLDPPMLLVCLAKSSYYYSAFTQCGGFAVNVLSEAQKEVAQCFASRIEDRFSQADWSTTSTGMPIFADVVTWFDCRRVNVVDAGDHAIIVGEVIDFCNGSGKGLGYVRGSFFTLSMEEEALQISQLNQSVELKIIIEKRGEVFFKTNDSNRLELPSTIMIKGDSLQARLNQLIQSLGFSELANYIYSIYEDTEANKHHIVYHTVTENDSVQGAFLPLNDALYQRLESVAEVTMLKRFAAESQVGEFGLYVGDHRKGKIFPT